MTVRPETLFAGDGEMASLMRATDWSRTGLGPVERWPGSLRTMLGVALGSRFPMLIWWGPELLHLYNDAYRPILRDKHPASLGAPAAEIWSEIWEVAGPMARGVMEGGPPTWTEHMQLFIKSGSMAEETYFTFSYSPIPDDDGGVGGVLNIVQETTQQVQADRQVRMLHELAERAAEAKTEDEAYRVAAEVLAVNQLDLPFALLYRLNERRDHARLVAASGWKAYDGPAKPAELALGGRDESTSWPLAAVLHDPRELLVDDLSRRFGALPAGRWSAHPEHALVVPMYRAGQAQPHAFLIAGVSPHRRLDERYRRFFRATADQVASVIAHARAYEEETRRAETLAEIDRAKTAFFSNVSHEFRTPLTLILGPIEEALAKPGAALQGEPLAAVQRSALRLLRMVNSLLDFARIEAGRLQLAFAPSDVAALTSDLASSFRSLVERAGLRFVVDCPPVSEPVYLDVRQWEKIVLNLVSNAFKFTLAGEIAVRLRSHGSAIELSVSDTGSGIPEHALPHVFERFQRVEGTPGRSFEGTGIGLSLVQELVRLHGGSVRVSSVVGQGSRFEVTIPTGCAHLPADRIAASAQIETSGAAPYLLEAARWIDSGASGLDPGAPALHDALPTSFPSGSSHARARILIADDNTDMREYLVRLLSPRFSVECAEDGRSALARARRETPDLVLSDVMMPGIDGVALLRALRSHPKTSHVPVVLLSARAGEEAVLEGIATGADDYLVKPFTARELVARVHTHLELARMRREWSSELERANGELEAFSYSVSHDLRAPLRAIDGFSKALLDEYAARLDEQGRHYLERVRAGSQRMAQLIDDLLSLSRITRASLQRERVDLTALALRILAELGARDPQRRVDAQVADGLVAQGDPGLIAALLQNLLDNAWKFTSKQARARIEVGRETLDGEAVFLVRDDGAGFDMEHARRLFTPFQRLHTSAEFEGTGIGLATVHRIVTRHLGRVWAEASPGQGATFFFTLGKKP
jgi:signal transduction histidine kinase